MATSTRRAIEYPTADGKPMAETHTHAQDMMDLIQTLQHQFAADPEVYVTGNLLMFYEEGDRRKHVSPDVFVVRGVPKEPPRDHYLVWEEGKGPDIVIELTSKSTRAEDEKKKLALYRDVLKVPEYFLFDPREEYLKPSMKGYRLRRGRYAAIDPVRGRLPSEALGLHLERRGTELRLFDPSAGLLLRTPRERAEGSDAARELAEATRAWAEAVRLRDSAALLNAETRARLAEADAERLRREIDDLRRRLDESGS